MVRIRGKDDVMIRRTAVAIFDTVSNAIAGMAAADTDA
jgi:hypothetical protein